MDIENIPGKNLLGRLEDISLDATSCNLYFKNLKEVESQINEIAGFLGITHELSAFFSCLAELSIQRTVSLESLVKHLKCSILTLLNCMSEIERVLRPSKLRTYIRELKRNGLSSGITSIFHGVPGTGKTGSVYQKAY